MGALEFSLVILDPGIAFSKNSDLAIAIRNGEVMHKVVEPVGDDDNRIMIEFYESNLEFLKTYPIHALRESVLKTAAVMLHSSSYHDSDWREYAYEMGVKENLHLDTIQESAKLRKELPLFITMTITLKRRKGNLADIIQVFIKQQRYDVLSLLKPSIKKLLERIPDTEVKGYAYAEQQFPALRNITSDLSSETTEELSCETVSTMFDSYTENCEKVFTTELDPISVKKHTAFELNALTKNSACRNPMPEIKLYPSSKLRELSHNGSLSQESILPSAPPTEEYISVLIQHTESDIKVAKQLCQILKDGGLAASTLFDMEGLIRMDPTGAINKVFQEADFIVPVVSEEFLQQIDPQFCGNYDAMSNRTLYQLITNEYQYNGCVNFRVRPVLVPDLKRCQKLNSNVILTYSFQLWKECEKLIRILKETKELLKQFKINKMIKAPKTK